MKRRTFLAMAVSATFALSGCNYVKPASGTGTITAPSTKRAMRAAVAAANELGWTPRTVSVETGYMLAEQEVGVVSGSEKHYIYTLAVQLPERGRGDVQVTVTPPVQVLGGTPTTTMVDEFLKLFSQKLKG